MNEMDDAGAGAAAPEVPAAADGADGAGGAVTGDSRVNAALRGLDSLGDLPVAEHPRVFERAHAGLVDVLEDLRSSGDPPDSGR